MADVDEKRAEFVAQVGEKLGALSAEKPTVSEQELAHALLLGDGSLEPDRLMDALDDLAAASVAVQVGANAEHGRMWRHSGLDDDEARRLLAVQRELARREAAAEAAAAAVDEGDVDSMSPDGAGEEEGGVSDEPVLAARSRPNVEPGTTQRVELPMKVAGALDEDSIGKLVTAGLRAAEEARAGFEFIVTA